VSDKAFIRRRYDRIAGFFRLFEWLFLLPPGLRRTAVERLELSPGGSYCVCRGRQRDSLE
jgi:hypothetical protein